MPCHTLLRTRYKSIFASAYLNLKYRKLHACSIFLHGLGSLFLHILFDLKFYNNSIPLMLAYSIYIVFPPAYMKQSRPSGRSRIFPLFMEMEVSFLCAREPTTGSYTEAGKCRSALHEFCCLTAALLKGFCNV